MKKIISILAVIAMLTTVSCSNAGKSGDSSDSSTEVSQPRDSEEVKQALMQSTTCYKREKIEMPDDLVYINHVERLPDGTFMFNGYDSHYQNRYFYKADADFGNITRMEFEHPEAARNADGSYDMISFNADGSFCVLTHLEDHGGVTLPDEYDESFDYDSYNNNCIYTKLISTYSASGELLTSAEVDYPDELYDQYNDITGSMPIADGDSMIQAFSDNSVRRIASDGSLTVLVQPDEDSQPNFSAPYIFRDRDGKIIVLKQEQRSAVSPTGMEYFELYHVFCELNENGLSDELYSCSEAEMQQMPTFGVGDVRFFVPTYEGLIAVKDDGSTETVIDWRSSGFDSMFVFAVSETDFIGVDTYSESGRGVYRLTPRDMSELADTQIITVNNSIWQDVINEFNSSQTQYRVEVIDYPFDDGNQQLNMDLISGKAPDVILFDDYASFVNYSNKGLFRHDGGLKLA